MSSITFEQVQLFSSLFKGRNDIYARRWEKDGKSGYSPAYEVDWAAYKAFKAKGGNLLIFQIRSLCFSQPKLSKTT